MTEIVSCVVSREWDDYVLDNGGHPLQLWGWGELKQHHGWQVARLFAKDGGAVVGAAQVLIYPLPFPFRSFGYIPRGPVKGSGDEQILEAIAHFIKQTFGSVSLTVEPALEEFDVPTGWQPARNHILSAETILLDLNKTTEELQAPMAKKTRQYIRKSSQEVAIRQVEKGELEDCLAMYKQTAQRAGFAIHDDTYYRQVAESLGEHSVIFGAYAGSTLVAFLWLAVSSDTAYELYGGVSDEGQQLRANYALKWHAIQKTREWGVSSYDFGGLIEGGVTTFKRGWAEHETKLAGTFDYPLSPLYALYAVVLPKAKKAVQFVRGLRSK